MNVCMSLCSVHHCRTQHNTEQLWQTSILSFRQSLSPVYMIQPVVKPVWRKCLYTRCNRVCQLFVQHDCQNRLTTGCIVYTNIQPVVKQIWQPFGCLFTRYNRLSNRLYNRLAEMLSTEGRAGFTNERYTMAVTSFFCRYFFKTPTKDYNNYMYAYSFCVSVGSYAARKTGHG